MNFDAAVGILLAHEGGLVDDPADPGGLTQWGISQRAYPTLDIRALTRDGAVAIYKRDFWDHIGGDTLPPGVAFQLFDFAVNAGIGTAIRKAQDVAGVADDGNWGPVTQAAVAALAPAAFIARFAAAKIRFYTKLANWPDSGKGWMVRIAEDIEEGFQ